MDSNSNRGQHLKGKSWQTLLPTSPQEPRSNVTERTDSECSQIVWGQASKLSLPLQKDLLSISYLLGFLASNNEAEYETILVGLRIETTFGVTWLEVRCDFSLVVNQVSEEYIANDARMADARMAEYL